MQKRLKASITLSVFIGLAGHALATPLLAQNGPDNSSGPVANDRAANDRARCLETDQVSSYKTENDKAVRFLMTDGKQLLLRLKRQCPQLHFHRYISYTPIDGKLCAGRDKVKTRAGVSCRIYSISDTVRPETNIPNSEDGAGAKPGAVANPAAKPDILHEADPQ